MDNLTHSLVGLAAAKAGLERVSPYATVVCVLAANAPDADIVTLVGGSLTYLEHHRGITHSIAGTLAIGLLFPILFYWGERLSARLRGREPRARLGGLIIASLLLTASHPLLDWTNSYGLRPYLPWSGEWIYGDIVFVVDPWLWLILGGAGFLLTAKTNMKVALWATLGFIVAGAILFLPQTRGFEIPWQGQVVWIVGLLALVISFRAGLGERFGEKIALGALAFVLFYWGALAFLHERAQALSREVAASAASQRGESLERLAAMPVPMNPFEWLTVAETGRATYRFRVNLLNGGESDLQNDSARYQKPPQLDGETVERVRESERGRIFLDFARFPVFQIRDVEGEPSSILITDVRFREPPEKARERTGGGFTLEVPIRNAGEASQ